VIKPDPIDVIFVQVGKDHTRIVSATAGSATPNDVAASWEAWGQEGQIDP
jgi:hypothetical protein